MTVRLSRRALLRTTALATLGGGLVLAGPGLGASAGAAPLTASALSRLRGRTVEVRTSSGTGTAVVEDVLGNGSRPVGERSFRLVLRSSVPLADSGEVVVLRHDRLGRHELFTVPHRDPTRWIAVVLDYADVAPGPGR
jgi:Domain of unknown function (DUF6916)